MGGTAASVAGNRRWLAVDFVPKGAQKNRALTTVTSLIGRKCIINLSGKKLEILLLNSQWTGDQHLIVRSREKMRFLENDLLTFL